MVASGGGTASACGAARCASGPALTSIASGLQPGGVAAEATIAPGAASSFFSPAPVADLSKPAKVVLSGPDAPDPFVLVDGSHEYLYTSNGTLTDDERSRVHAASVTIAGEICATPSPACRRGRSGDSRGLPTCSRVARGMGALLHRGGQRCVAGDAVHR